MDKVSRINEVAKKYENELKCVFGDYSIRADGNNVAFVSGKGKKYKINLLGESKLVLLREKDNVFENFEIYCDSNLQGVVIKERKIKKLGDFKQFDFVNRLFGVSKFDNDRNVLLGICERCFILSKDHSILMSNKFEAKFDCLTTIFENARSYKWIPYPAGVYLNGRDISHKFMINGENKIAIIYDIYCGNINKQNCGYLTGIVDPNIYGLKYYSLCEGNIDLIKLLEQEGRPFVDIDEKEAKALIYKKVGTIKKFDATSVSSLVEMFHCELSASEYAKSLIEKNLGISYAEFEALDFDEKRKIIDSYHQNHSSDEDFIIMIPGCYNYELLKIKKGRKILTPIGYYIAGENFGEFYEIGDERAKDILSDKTGKMLDDFKEFYNGSNGSLGEVINSSLPKKRWRIRSLVDDILKKKN